MAKSIYGYKRVVIEGVTPEVDSGRFPIKRVLEDVVTIEADVFADGHDLVAARLLFKREDATEWQSVYMTALGNDRWRGEFPVSEIGRYVYTVAGAIDRFGTWRSDLTKRIAAGQDVAIELLHGALILDHFAGLATGVEAARLTAWADVLRTQSTEESSRVLAISDEVLALVRKYPDKAFETNYDRELAIVVEREKARFSSWYELFPRSQGPSATVHGTFADCEARLPYVAELGFDVLYFPPIHPIGRAFRKGKNNTTTAEPGDVGSPWAIGAKEGGHTAILSDLGTLADFKHLLAKAKEFGLEIALDIAFQASPDHPWVTEHPTWFKHRADGTIQYAENPPKKYQDIYPLDFESRDWTGLWDALRDVFLYWAEQGVRIFRVDNPHTKAFPFWGWAIPEIKREYPDALFLSEAFTRPRVSQRLAKVGFTQAYTYFTWRNTKQELTEYLEELNEYPLKEYFWPNFWPNTPDILPVSLQSGGEPAFLARLVMAATMTSNYGIYGAAFELMESVPFKPGSEEYLNSEKYEIKHWDLDSPVSLKNYIAQVNAIRRENKALQANDGLGFHPTDNPYLLSYSKSTKDGLNRILVVVNLDPTRVQSGFVTLDLAALGLKDDQSFVVHDLLTDRRYSWSGQRNYVELRPAELPAHIFRISDELI
ncbi:maltotransferase domain-containing protein [Acidisarcina polymorpha]|nr:maltotransferase domain-containing protein [Acidisarcina polymorpha]